MTRPQKPGALRIGPLSPRGTGQHAPIRTVEFDQPSYRITNASSTGTYSGAKDLSYRGQTVRLPSRGVGC